MSQPLPACLSDKWELKVQPKKILAIHLNATGQEELLVRWADLPEFENSRELKTDIRFQLSTLRTRWFFKWRVLIETPSLLRSIYP